MKNKMNIALCFLVALLLPAIAIGSFPNSFTNAVDGITTVSAALINQLEAKVGVNGSTDPNSLDYKINTLTTSLRGIIIAFGGTTPPTGFLLCDGSAVSRTTYSALFAIIGTAYGVGNGSTTFNLPDLRQRFPLGKAVSGTGATLGGTGGQIDPSGSVSVNISGSLTTGFGGFPTGEIEGSTPNFTGTGTGYASVSNPPFQTVNYIIKY